MASKILEGEYFQKVQIYQTLLLFKCLESTAIFGLLWQITRETLGRIKESLAKWQEQT